MIETHLQNYNKFIFLNLKINYDTCFPLRPFYFDQQIHIKYLIYIPLLKLYSNCKIIDGTIRTLDHQLNSRVSLCGHYGYPLNQKHRTQETWSQRRPKITSAASAIPSGVDEETIREIICKGKEEKSLPRDRTNFQIFGGNCKISDCFQAVSDSYSLSIWI